MRLLGPWRQWPIKNKDVYVLKTASGLIYRCEPDQI